MENPVLQIKDALIWALKKIDPDTDVFFEEIKSTDPAHGVEQPKTWYFVDLKPGSPVTVDGIYTDMSVMVDVTYHEKGESNNAYLIKAAEIDAAIRPVLSFGDRKITIGNADINVVDHVLHYIFTINFRHSEEQKVANDRMEELGFLNDAAYAAQVVRYYSAKGYGERKLRDELYRRGIPRELWDEALEGAADPSAAIEEFLRKKWRGTLPDDPRELKKASDALARRGYSWSDIVEGLRRYGAEAESDE